MNVESTDFFVIDAPLAVLPDLSHVSKTKEEKLYGELILKFNTSIVCREELLNSCPVIHWDSNEYDNEFNIDNDTKIMSCFWIMVG